MKSIYNKIENTIGQEIVSSKKAVGGSIATSSVIETTAGNKYFLKTGFSNSMFIKEANGLREIAKSNSIRTPKVIIADDDFLLLEYIQPANKRSDLMRQLGLELAQMHRFTSDEFGFFEDNFIGATPQINTPTDESWSVFYWQNRLCYQYQLALSNGYCDSEFKKAFRRLEAKIDSILNPVDEPPTLLHGDLWGGNYISDENGAVLLIDPAVYYGHREADLAMTKLFGGFDHDFYSAYNEAFPLADNWEYREPIYKLYHILNHLNLFGTSYLSEAKRLMNFY